MNKNQVKMEQKITKFAQMRMEDLKSLVKDKQIWMAIAKIKKILSRK